MTIAAGTRLGPYEVLAPLGAGGMGEVYRARDSRLGREVAVKVLPEPVARDAEALSRFEREARAVAALSHPNILAIHDFGSHGGVSYAVTELLEGETLRERLAVGPLPWRKAVEIGIAISEGLAAAHAKAIVHRDLKPENVFVTEDGRVKILDFGLAREDAVPAPYGATSVPTTPATAAGTVLGTVGYMSPEQVRGQPADARSDIFSLGCVLHETIAGSRAFSRETGAETMTAILREEPPPLSQRGRAIPAELERVVARCLEKNPGERLQSARDLAVRLKDILAISAGTAVRPRDAVPGRRRIAIGAAAAVLAVAAAFLLFRGWRHGRGIDSLAVLPFVNASGDPGTEYLSDGITETLINRLSQVRGLRVVPRSTAFRYKGQSTDPQAAGRALNVRAVLTGRISKRGEALNVQADLVDVERESQLWGEQYNRPASDLLAVQEAIASEIAARLKIRLTGDQEERLGRPETRNPQAYELYLKGRYHWNRRTAQDLDKAVGYFEEAIRRDPSFALAHAGLADAYIVMPQYTGRSTMDTIPKGIAAAKKALELDESLAAPHAALGFAEAIMSWDWEASARELEKAIELDPNYPTAHHWYALTLAAVGRVDEALAEARKARELDPVSIVIANLEAPLNAMARRWDDAIAAARRTLGLDADASLAWQWLGKAYQGQGLYREATEALEKAAVLAERRTEVLGDLGNLYAASGRRSDALAILEELERPRFEGYDPSYQLALVYTGLGRKQEALRELGRAVELHNGALRFVNIDWRFDPLRADPRFAEIVRRVGLKR